MRHFQAIPLNARSMEARRRVPSKFVECTPEQTSIRSNRERRLPHPNPVHAWRASEGKKLLPIHGNNKVRDKREKVSRVKQSSPRGLGQARQEDIKHG